MGSPSLFSSSRGPFDATNRRRVHRPSVILISLPTAFSLSQYAQPLIRPEWFFRPVKLPAISGKCPSLVSCQVGTSGNFLRFLNLFW